MIFNVFDYGAKGDGRTNDAAAIQKAIDECSAKGGTVLLPGGYTFRSGSIVLKSNTELHLENGAVLKASDDMEDFNLFSEARQEAGLDVPTYENCDYEGRPKLFFLYACSADNVRITGSGTIDGNEEIYYGKVTKWHIDGSFYPRMPLFYLEDIHNLTIKDVTLTHSAFWTVHMIGCRDVLIDGIRIYNNTRLANSDGIDPDHCQNVRIANCFIEGADDCIVFKNTESAKKYGPCQNITVSNCILSSTSAAVKFGSESTMLFRNIVVNGCVIRGTNRGISLQLRDEGSIENCIFSNISIETRMFSSEHWWGKAEPIAITAVPRREDTKIGHVKNLVFMNIMADTENGITVYGTKDADGRPNISGLRFENISIDMSWKTRWPKNLHDLRPYYGKSIIESPLAAIYMRNAEGISFSNFRWTADEKISAEMGPAFDIEDSENITGLN